MTPGKTVEISVPAATVPNDLEAFWLPFTPNRAFKRAPRLFARAKDMHYFTPEGRAVLDGTAGLWCSNAGHSRDPIVAAIQRQAAELDFAPAFQFATPHSFELASRIAALSVIRAPRRSIPRSRSRSLITMYAGRARAPG
jgi:beta-alanine--pyruvate transaminase